MRSDGVPAFIVKDCIYPKLWKISCTTPLHKSGHVGIIQNYHPTSIICNSSKF